MEVYLHAVDVAEVAPDHMGCGHEDVGVEGAGLGFENKIAHAVGILLAEGCEEFCDLSMISRVS
jgi:hypothetical protein